MTVELVRDEALVEHVAPEGQPDAPSDDAPRARPPRSRAGAGTLVLFTATTFVSASLLFLVQPMVAKMLLPELGGSAAVWNTATVFFQAALLLGYLFSHLSLRRLGVRRQPWLQIGVVAAGAIALPIAVPGGWHAPAGSPSAWTMLVLAVMVGLPFFVLSTVSPTIQRWFAATDHPHAADPYFLYAAGNVGSLLALLAYPLLLEPFLPLGSQSRAWALGYAVFAVLIAGCAWVARSHAKATPTDGASESLLRRVLPALSMRTRLGWVVTAAIPSALMLAVTRHLSSDVAAMPLLWVAPLALYLGTFVVAFGHNPERAMNVSGRALKLLAVPLALSFLGFLSSIAFGITLHLAVFTAAAMVAHARLSLQRPETERLTDFYLMLSVGGVLGGALSALVAPLVFDTIAEYPLFVVAALVLLPASAFTAGSDRSEGRARSGRFGVDVRAAATAAVVIGAAVGAVAVRSGGTQQALTAGMLVAAVGVGLAYVLTRSAVGFAGAIGVVLAAGLLVPACPTAHQARTFYGVHRVYIDEADRGRHVLLNGSTVHGVEYPTGPDAHRPTTYYHPSGPVGRWFATRRDDGPERIDVVGLGSGALAWYGRKGDHMRFYEIDEAVVDIAEDPSLFTFVDRSAADVSMHVGDGRLLLEHERGPKADALVVDAFSGDSIPAHLLTTEAFSLYLQRLAPHGSLVVHISNRFFDFEPVVARLAAAHGLVAYVGHDEPTPEETAEGKLASTWVVMGRRPADTGVAGEPGWKRLGERDDVPLWTDERSDLLRLLRGI